MRRELRRLGPRSGPAAATLAAAGLSLLPPLPLPPILQPPPAPQPPSQPPGDQQHHRHEPRIRVATTGRHAERIRTVPITRRAGAAPRVALSLRLPGARSGGRVRLSAEVQASTTCPPVRRETCIKRPYHFNPVLTARLVLADSQRAVRRPHARAVSRRQRLTCHQRPPNRNHHCPLVLAPHLRLGSPSRRPCRKRCYVNLVLAAHNRHARRRQVVVVGGDRPSGRVAQGKARLGAVVLPPRASRRATRVRDTSLARDLLPTAASKGSRAQVLYSVKLPRLRPGDLILAGARSRVAIDALPYNVYVGSKVILARSPTATTPDAIAARSAILGGYVTPGNGFNCTRGRSGYRSPCELRKAGLTVIRRAPRASSGRRVPLYVNLVSGAGALLATLTKEGDVARVLPGYLKVVRFRR